MPNDSKTIRILDASLNRASEGLRVAEDYVRFVLGDAHLTRLLKEVRHDLAAAAVMLPAGARLEARDTQTDVGTDISTSAEACRSDALGVCMASFERAKQSLRSLEEYSKIESAAIAAEFEALRYRLYTIESAVGRTEWARDRLGETRLYVLIDGCESVAQFASLIGQLVEAGADAIQLRDRRLSDAELLVRARLLVQQTRAVGTAVDADANDASRSVGVLSIVNDRADLTAAADADGVHLGQDDLGVSDARRILGPGKLVGVSTHTIEQARAAVLDGANYLGAGPTFPSQTKSFSEYPGIEFLQQVSTEIALPAFAIGGITAENLPLVSEAGIHRIAVSEAIVAKADPGAAACEIRKLLHPALA